MPKFDVPENVTVEEFFKTHVPAQFKEMMSGVDLSWMGDRQFTLQFDVGGKKHCILVKGSQGMEVVCGGIDKPMLCIALSEKDWRDSITGKVEGVMDQFTDPKQAADAGRYGTLQKTRGTLKVELSKSDNTIMPLSLIFNGEAQPSVTLKLSLPDWVALQSKQVDGPSLVMGGKMQFDGDMMFLMSLQQLM